MELTDDALATFIDAFTDNGIRIDATIELLLLSPAEAHAPARLLQADADLLDASNG